MRGSGGYDFRLRCHSLRVYANPRRYYIGETPKVISHTGGKPIAGAESTFRRVRAMGEGTEEHLLEQGDAHFDAEEYDAAESLYRAALAQREASPGIPSEPVAVALNRLANVHYKRKEDFAAGELFAQALVIREAILPPDAPDLRLSVNNLANAYRNQGRFAEAEPLYRRSLAMLERQTGHTDHPPVWRNLIRVLEGQGKQDEAAEFTERLRAWEMLQSERDRPAG